jgi:hypothetical protein
MLLGKAPVLPQFFFVDPIPLDTKFVFHYSRVMKNVTITLDEDVARWARIRAAERNTSVSRLVGELLREQMHDEEKYLLARQQYLPQPPQKLKKSNVKYPTRTELHAR